ncbi:UDP-galactopyranose mutase [Elioraea sp.]|uniref:UDP-galactopyranose mutase n=1 Tax=Elioraea sp. TaxID=2185103 RepID=UPI0025C62358|nr:UDP-galactopyranose mutase [Elioraea sp.]
MSIPTYSAPRIGARPALICFSHLRWDSVFQRPQQLMARFARERDVYVFEEPEAGDAAFLRRRTCPHTGVHIATPVLPEDAPVDERRRLLDALLAEVGPASAWYYTPMARAFSAHAPWRAAAFDCMDDLARFRFAPPDMAAREAELLASVDVAFTGGASLHAARRNRHHNIHCLPSGVDLAHFMTARDALDEPADQASLAHPILGYFGVIDERLDMALLAELAARRPDWTIVMVGPVAKLAPDELPAAANIRWLGARDYRELPAFLAHWDVALMPFALNEATRFISPTKAPEYLAGGKRVVSTRIVDVERRFAGMAAVTIADDAAGFVDACEAAMRRQDAADFTEVDDLLATISWEGIHHRMATLLDEAEAEQLPKPAMIRGSTLTDDLVVGAGFAGSVIAERLARAGRRVTVIDRRPHIAGNAHDELDEAGILVHRYGPHIFHTNSDMVLSYLSRFTAWRPYEHRVLARVGASLLPMPINRTTLNRVFGVSLGSEAEAEAFLRRLARPVDTVASARDFVIGSVGPHLYEMFFRGYSLKQWGVDPALLDASVTARVPARTTTDDRYFLDRHQCMPANGYTRMFENILDHDNITVLTATDYRSVATERVGRTVFTGPIDAFYDWRLGPLPYRSLVFEHSTVDAEFVQPVATINYPGLETPYTRSTEFKHLTGQRHRRTSICRERSSAEGEPYYPVPAEANRLLYRRYRELGDAERSVTFLGRLGTYQYMNMDQVVAQALRTADRLLADAPTVAAAAE